MSSNLTASWKQTTAYLLDARSHLSEAAEGIYSDEIKNFEEYLEHNELELALDELESLIYKSGFESLRVFELLALAAANMKLEDRVKSLDTHISTSRGIPYTTKLPNAA